MFHYENLTNDPEYAMYMKMYKLAYRLEKKLHASVASAGGDIDDVAQEIWIALNNGNVSYENDEALVRTCGLNHLKSLYGVNHIGGNFKKNAVLTAYQQACDSLPVLIAAKQVRQQAAACLAGGGRPKAEHRQTVERLIKRTFEARKQAVKIKRSEKPTLLFIEKNSEIFRREKTAYMHIADCLRGTEPGTGKKALRQEMRYAVQTLINMAELDTAPAEVISTFSCSLTPQRVSIEDLENLRNDNEGADEEAMDAYSSVPDGESSHEPEVDTDCIAKLLLQLFSVEERSQLIALWSSGMTEKDGGKPEGIVETLQYLGLPAELKNHVVEVELNKPLAKQQNLKMRKMIIKQKKKAR